MNELETELELIRDQKKKLDDCIEHLEALKALLPETEIQVNKKFYRDEIRRLTDQELELKKRINLLLDDEDESLL